MTEKEAFKKIEFEVTQFDKLQNEGFTSLEGSVRIIISLLRDLMQNPDYQEKKSKYLDTISMLDSRLRNEIRDVSNARTASTKKNAAQKRQNDYRNAVAKAVDAVKRDLGYVLYPELNKP